MLRLARLAAFALALGAAPVAAQAAACGPTYGADGLAVGADGGLWLTHYEDARLAYRTPDGRWHDRETLVAGKPVGLSGLRLDEERGVAWAVSADSTKIIRISLRDGSANATALDGVILHHRGPLPGDGAGGLWVLSAAAGASWLEQPFLWHIGADGKVLERKA
ncbi:MAG TPA: hypothetical protein VK196_01560, partial [Magnetospirillum sp.]|nr:hypothetical protein [Magnetospirillum sp.]